MTWDCPTEPLGTSGSLESFYHDLERSKKLCAQFGPQLPDELSPLLIERATSKRRLDSEGLAPRFGILQGVLGFDHFRRYRLLMQRHGASCVSSPCSVQAGSQRWYRPLDNVQLLTDFVNGIGELSQFGQAVQGTEAEEIHICRCYCWIIFSAEHTGLSWQSLYRAVPATLALVPCRSAAAGAFETSGV